MDRVRFYLGLERFRCFRTWCVPHGFGAMHGEIEVLEDKEYDESEIRKFAKHATLRASVRVSFHSPRRNGICGGKGLLLIVSVPCLPHRPHNTVYVGLK